MIKIESLKAILNLFLCDSSEWVCDSPGCEAQTQRIFTCEASKQAEGGLGAKL